MYDKSLSFEENGVSIKGLFPDSTSIIFLMHQSIDVHVRSINPKFESILIFHKQVVHNHVNCKCPIEFYVENIIGSYNVPFNW